MLVERLQERLETYEFLRQEKEAELIRKKELEAQLAEEAAEKESDEMEEDEEPPDEEDEGNQSRASISN